MLLKECFVLCERMDPNTPTGSGVPRPRHMPTPKMSERKKKLFDDNSIQSSINKGVIDEEEDSDLGPMGLLECDSSPSSFKRIMGSSMSDYFIENKPKSHSIFENVLEEDQNLLQTPSRSVMSQCNDDAHYANEDDDSKSEDLEQSREDKFVSEDNYAMQMKTPNDVHLTTNDKSGVRRSQSFKKSLQFDANLTPNAVESNARATATIEAGVTDHPKAKTSLRFPTEPMFSVKSFYGQKDEEQKTLVQKSYMLTNKLPLLYTQALEAQQTRAKPKKALTRGPLLWNHGGGAIRRMRRQTLQQKLKKSRKRKVVAGGDTENHDPSVGTQHKLNAEEATKRQEQRERIQKVFNKHIGDASRPINWDSSNAAISVDLDRSFDDHSDDDNDDNDVMFDGNENDGINECVPSTDIVRNDDHNEIQKTRKFFKNPATNSTKKYQVLGGIKATMKRGCDLKLERPAKRKKKAKTTETVVLHHEITSIIDRLSSPRKTQIPLDETEMTSLSPTVETSTKPMNKTLVESFSEAENVSEQDITLVDCNPDTYDVSNIQSESHQETSQHLENLCRTKLNDAFTKKRVSSQTSLSSASSSPVSKSTSVSSGLDEIHEEPGRMDQHVLPMPMSPASQISNMTLSLAIHCNSKDDAHAEKTPVSYFPIFNKSSLSTGATPNKTLFDRINAGNKKWRAIGDRQYQIDAGQKEFGMKTCAQCEMSYSVHEPEDEQLHLQYHNAASTLAFKGWTNERLITQIPEWGLQGRIILVCENDSKSKKIRIKDIMTVVDRHLGFARTTLAPKTLVYLAIAKNQVIGVCVAQPLSQAHRLISENGLDFCSIQIYTVKCGISRIWVAPPYRRYGVASRLITCVRGNFIFGKYLSIDEIAFSSPTEDGKRFASKLCQREDFLIYDG